MASETANNVAGNLTRNTSTTTAAGGASTASGTGAGGMQQTGKDLLNREINIDQRKGGSIGLALAPYQQQVAQSEAQKGITGLSFAHTLGDVRNRIAQDRMDSREEEAQAGFIGSGAQARRQVEENRKISNTLDTQENDYTNNLRNLNAKIGSARQQELTLGQPLIAKGIARQAARDNSLYNFKSDENIFGKFAGAWGKSQTTHAELNKSKFQQNKAMQSLVSQFGIDINGPDFENQVNTALGKILTTKMSSVYDPTIDINFDNGSGSKTISTQTRSVASQVLGDILGGVNVVGLPLAAISAGTSMMGAAATEAIGAIGAIGDSVGGALEGIDATLQAAGASIDLTASEAVGAGFGGVIEQAAGELGVDLGEATGQSIGEGFAQSLEEAVGEETYAAASSETTMSALGAAKNTFVQIIESGGSVEEATQAAVVNAEGILANTETMNGVFEATSGAETGAGAESAGAGVGAESTGAGVPTQGAGVPGEATGVPTSEAGVGTPTPAPVEPTPAPVEPTQPTVPEPPVQQPGALSKGINAIKSGVKAGAGAIRNTAASVGKTAFKLAWKTGGKVLGTSIGQVYGVSTAIANTVASKLEGMKGSELSGETMDAIIKELIQQEGKGK